MLRAKKKNSFKTVGMLTYCVSYSMLNRFIACYELNCDVLSKIETFNVS